MVKNTDLKFPWSKISLYSSKINIKYFLLFTVILISAILRLYKGADFFFWQPDEDILGLTMKKILIDHDLQLIGFPIPGGLFIGPAFFYIVAIPYSLVKMNPKLLYLASAFLGTFATFLVYFVGKTIFKKEAVGIFAAIIFGFSYLVNTYHRLLTGLTLGPILALLTYLVIHKLLTNKKSYHYIFLALVLAVSIQNEGSSFSLFALALVCVIIWRIKIPLKNLLGIIVIFFLFHVPLIIFDLKHNFFLLKSNVLFFVKRVEILKADSGNEPLLDIQSLINSFEFFPKTLSRMLFISGPRNTADQILPCPDLISQRITNISPYAYILSIVILSAFIIWQILLKKKDKGQRIILFHLVLMFLGLLAYNLFMPNYYFEWINVIFFPAFALIVGYFLYKLKEISAVGKIAVVIFLIFFITFNLKSLLSSTSHFGLNSKTEAVKYALSKVEGQPFFLESIGSCYSQGYLYLFWYLGQLPSHNYGIGMQFAPTLVPEPKGPKPNLGIILVNPSKEESGEFWLKYNSYKSKTLTSQKFDQIEVLVVKE